MSDVEDDGMWVGLHAASESVVARARPHPDETYAEGELITQWLVDDGSGTLKHMSLDEIESKYEFADDYYEISVSIPIGGPETGDTLPGTATVRVLDDIIDRVEFDHGISIEAAEVLGWMDTDES